MMELAVLHELPTAPLTHFERTAELPLRDVWCAEVPDAPQNQVVWGVRAGVTSSFKRGTLEHWVRFFQFSPSITSSRVETSSILRDSLQAELRADSVNAFEPATNLLELRRLTDLTWERLANLLNVDRRTLNNWVKGADVRPNNREHIAKTLSVLRYADRGTAQGNIAALDDQTFGETPFEAIRAQRYSIARRYMRHGAGRSQSVTSFRDWIGEFQSIHLHEGADISEALEPLPPEPRPLGVKRQVKRN
jgi:transcriptional regulator with XRE-family HTH domain